MVNWVFSQQKDLERGVKSAKNNETINEIKKEIYVFLFDGYSDWEISYLTPEIKKREPFKIVQQREEPFDLKSESEIQATVSKAYADCWNNNRHKNFDAFKNIDPLSNTEYRWH